MWSCFWLPPCIYNWSSCTSNNRLINSFFSSDVCGIICRSNVQWTYKGISALSRRHRVINIKLSLGVRFASVPLIALSGACLGAITYVAVHVSRCAAFLVTSLVRYLPIFSLNPSLNRWSFVCEYDMLSYKFL
jgi:hypothetical protein